MFAVPMTNIAEGHTRYRIDDAAHLALRRLVRGFAPALSIIGVYHSHPAHDPRPSPTDVAEAMYPDWIYVIVGLKGGRARVEGFRIRRQRVRRVAIRAR